MVSDPLFVGKKGFFQTPVVCYVLSLSIDSVDRETILRNRVVTVLLDHALRSVPEVEVCLMVPPVLVVAILIELPASVVEAMSDLMSDNETNGTEV